MISTPEPFGPPAQRCRVRREALPLGACAEPLEAFLRLRGSHGGVLMESADQGAPTGRYSVVVPNPSLRLVLRGTGATFEACASALRSAGAQQIVCVSFARAVDRGRMAAAW